MKLKDILSPFYVWKRTFQKPYTVRKPIEEHRAADHYRGFHTNDIDKCIGCGSCSRICMNGSIDMVPAEGKATTANDSGLRPRFDYGRCCWCALCVDICPTGSLKMSNDYLWVDTDPEQFRYTPGIDKKTWDDNPKGYKRDPGFKLLCYEQVEMPMHDPNEGVKSFIEMVKGYSAEQANKEADRCIECGICVATCPGHMDIPGYIKAVRENRIEDGLRIIYETNPMPAVCGRVCTHRCEFACALSRTGEPVAIRWLKRYIADQISPMDYGKILQSRAPDTGKKIAIIGAGPGGLSAAYYLALMGHAVTLYERSPHAGGMLRYGIPEYRLPYNQLDKDIQRIAELGVDIRCNSEIGKDIPFDDLYNKNDVVFFSTGLSKPSSIRVDGEDHPRVIAGLSLLDAVTRGETPELGTDVAVIGGGNVAIDAARTARRLGANVTIYYRRREVDMPADDEEIHEAKLDGVTILTQAVPLAIEESDETSVVLVWGEAEMVEAGDGGRPKPVLREGSRNTAMVNTIIAAIGQEADYSFLPQEIVDRLEFKRGSVVTDDYGRTADPKIFAGGDIANKVRDAISAIADGHRAARGIDTFLGNG
jgi:glutamate synthase (NADPH) small chain